MRMVYNFVGWPKNLWFCKVGFQETFGFQFFHIYYQVDVAKWLRRSVIKPNFFWAHGFESYCLHAYNDFFFNKLIFSKIINLLVNQQYYKPILFLMNFSLLTGSSNVNTIVSIKVFCMLIIHLIQCVIVVIDNVKRMHSILT